MIRILLASVVFAILQLGVPQGASAADLRPRGESTRVEPRFELFSKTSFTRAGTRADPGDEDRLAHTTAFAPAGPTPLRLQAAHRTPRSWESPPQGPVPQHSRLPRSRAPPA